MTHFTIRLSDLRSECRKQKSKATQAAWNSAIQRLEAAFPMCEDEYYIIITGTVMSFYHEATMVPYGETFVPLHEPYYEIESVDIDAIYWKNEKLGDREDHLEITLVDKDVLSSLEDMIADYFDKNQDELE